jgi:hypothetical protein
MLLAFLAAGYVAVATKSLVAAAIAFIALAFLVDKAFPS